MKKEHNSTASHHFVATHGKMVRKIASHMAIRLPACVCVEDLVQAGMLGLLEASQKYDPSRGVSFDTFAGFRIRGAMLDEMRKGDWVPRSVHRNSRLIEAAAQKLAHLNPQSSKQSYAIANMLGVPLRTYHTMRQDSHERKMLSLDDLGMSLDDVTCKNTGDDPLEGACQQVFCEAFWHAVSGLPEREQKVLSFYYDHGMTFKAIGMHMGVSTSRVCQIHREAVCHLRAALGAWVKQPSHCPVT